ncbi:CLUMA_CG004836, isoform A [Clunio marinus]|uniref:CLUMA_CG004836, isoform A n=1 Tax=Clunio marinus TaxID=568069 RepID=A0A1J1HX99_9DIPT|nr:CLUMA_CG004836, isoform A [Clunio marinus]
MVDADSYFSLLADESKEASKLLTNIVTTVMTSTISSNLPICRSLLFKFDRMSSQDHSSACAKLKAFMSN